MNEQRAFGESRVSSNVTQSSEVAFARRTLKKTSVAQDTITTFARLLLLYIQTITHLFIYLLI